MEASGASAGGASPPPGRERIVLAGRRIQKAAVAVDSRGRPHIVSDQGRLGTAIYYSYRVGNTWMSRRISPPGRITTRITEPNIVIDSRDRAYVAYWYYHYDLPSTTRTTHSCGFQEIRIGEDPLMGEWVGLGRGSTPVLNLDNEGRLHVHWRASGRKFLHRVFSGTRPLGGPENLFLVGKTFPNDPDAGCSSGNDSDVGADGIIHMACASQTLGLLYSNSDRSRRGVGVQIVGRPMEIGCCHEWTVCSLAVDRKDPRIIYIIFGGGDNRAYLIQRRSDGWARPRRLVPGGSTQSEKRAPPFIQALPDGGALAAWMDGRSGRYQIYLGAVSSNGRLGPVKRVTQGKNPRFALGPGGEVHLTFVRDGDLYYLRTTFP